MSVVIDKEPLAFGFYNEVDNQYIFYNNYLPKDVLEQDVSAITNDLSSLDILISKNKNNIEFKTEFPLDWNKIDTPDVSRILAKYNQPWPSKSLKWISNTGQNRKETKSLEIPEVITMVSKQDILKAGDQIKQGTIGMMWGLAGDLEQNPLLTILPVWNIIYACTD